MADVVAMGELLIDFTPAGRSQQGNEMFEKNPGGAPANVLAAVARLGGTAAFIGKVGDDQFGHYLKNILEENKIQSQGLRFSKEANTTLAFVHLDARGDRSFSFYRKPGADTIFSEKDIDYSLIDNAGIFHFGSLSMTTEPSRSATIKALEYAKGKGCVISYDPNWRPPLWENDKEARKWMKKGFDYADVLKISNNELEFLTGTDELDKGSELLSKKGIRLIAITLGAHGCYYRFGADTGHVPTYDTKVIDTTGAGDAFMGGLLYKLGALSEDIRNLEHGAVRYAMDFANATGALCASKRGAIPAMPLLGEVESCMVNVPKLLSNVL